MNDENLKMLRQVNDSLKEEYSQCLNILEEKKRKIAEIDVYLDSILNKEKSNLQIQEKEKLISESGSLENQIALQKSKIDSLEQILGEYTFALHVKQLSVLDIQEKERQRISRDLHDSSLQDLAHLIHQTELVSLYIDQDIVKAKLELASVEKGIRKVIDDVRNYIFNFRPMSFDDLGLKDSLENLFPTLNQNNKFVIKTDIDNILCDEKANSNTEIVLITIYRIIQECFQNAVKHSDGTEIFVSLKEDKNYYNIVVHDNGKGLDLEEASMKKKHFGLSVIRERVFLLNGQINIDNQDGTTITIQIPKKMIERPL